MSPPRDEARMLKVQLWHEPETATEVYADGCPFCTFVHGHVAMDTGSVVFVHRHPAPEVLAEIVRVECIGPRIYVCSTVPVSAAEGELARAFAETVVERGRRARGRRT